ncbi:hypothetical protein ACO2Q5_20320 [Neotabrizicola sp. VNH66]
MAQLLERILDASLPSVIAAYEKKISRLEDEKLLIREKMATATRPASSLDKTPRTALDFLANPWKLWKSDRLEDKQTVLKLAFADRPRHTRKRGFRTADLSMPFKILTQVSGAKSLVAEGMGLKDNLLQCKLLFLFTLYICVPAWLICNYRHGGLITVGEPKSGNLSRGGKPPPGIRAPAPARCS